MDPNKKDDQNTVPSSVPGPVSAAPVKEAGSVAVEQPVQTVERPISEYSSYPAPQVDENLAPIVKSNIAVKPPAEVASTPPLSAMGSSVIDINSARQTFEKGPIDSSPTWEAGVVVAQTERKEELKKAA